MSPYTLLVSTKTNVYVMIIFVDIFVFGSLVLFQMNETVYPIEVWTKNTFVNIPIINYLWKTCMVAGAEETPLPIHLQPSNGAEEHWEVTSLTPFGCVWSIISMVLSMMTSIVRIMMMSMVTSKSRMSWNFYYGNLNIKHFRNLIAFVFNLEHVFILCSTREFRNHANILCKD